MQAVHCRAADNMAVHQQLCVSSLCFPPDSPLNQSVTAEKNHTTQCWTRTHIEVCLSPGEAPLCCMAVCLVVNCVYELCSLLLYVSESLQQHGDVRKQRWVHETRNFLCAVFSFSLIQGRSWTFSSCAHLIWSDGSSCVSPAAVRSAVRVCGGRWGVCGHKFYLPRWCNRLQGSM